MPVRPRADRGELEPRVRPQSHRTPGGSREESQSPEYVPRATASQGDPERKLGPASDLEHFIQVKTCMMFQLNAILSSSDTKLLS